MKPLRVLLIGPAFPYRGGIANFNEALFRAMIREGHHCEIVSFSLQYPAFFFPGSTQFDFDRKADDIVSKRFINSIQPLSWFKAARYIVRFKPDIVVARFWLPLLGPALGSVCRLVKRKINVPVIGLTDNVIPHEKRPGDPLLTRYFLRSCDGFVAMSKAVLDDIGSFGIKSPGRMIPHPVYDFFGPSVSRSEARASLGIETDQKLILFFGFIRKYKGLDLLLKAMAKPEIRRAGIKLMIAGEYYEDQDYYERLIEELGISDLLILHTRYIPYEEVRNFFCASNLVVQPYHTASQSGVTQIAYHFSIPMIVTNVGGLGEMVENMVNGYVVETSPDEIADAMLDYFQHNRENAMTEKTSVLRDRFSWKAMVNGIIDLAEQIRLA